MRICRPGTLFSNCPPLRGIFLRGRKGLLKGGRTAFGLVQLHCLYGIAAADHHNSQNYEHKIPHSISQFPMSGKFFARQERRRIFCRVVDSLIHDPEENLV